jgi:hypothetical protein
MPNENNPAAVWSTAARAECFVNSSARRTNRHRGQQQAHRLDFGHINRAALARLPDLLARWLPGGRIEGAEYVALPPRRADRRPGSFKINLETGQWADFATGDKGGDAISLAAYLAGCSQFDAARRLAVMFGFAVDA